MDSVTICVCTTNPTDAPLFRLLFEPNERNGLQALSRLMVDKLTTVPRKKLGERLGRLDDGDMVQLQRAMLVFLGMAGSSRRR
jgi:mRNA interferase MazF